MAQSSISSILSSLDFDEGASSSSGGGINPGRSAASILLEERRSARLREESTSLFVAAKPVRKTDPLFAQIETSTTEAPTYWKTTIIRKPKKKATSSSAPKVIGKALRLKREKGLDYKLRSESKLANRGKRRERKEHLKNL